MRNMFFLVFLINKLEAGKNTGIFDLDLSENEISLNSLLNEVNETNSSQKLFDIEMLPEIRRIREGYTHLTHKFSRLRKIIGMFKKMSEDSKCFRVNKDEFRSNVFNFDRTLHIYSNFDPTSTTFVQFRAIKFFIAMIDLLYESIKDLHGPGEDSDMTLRITRISRTIRHAYDTCKHIKNQYLRLEIFYENYSTTQVNQFCELLRNKIDDNLIRENPLPRTTNFDVFNITRNFFCFIYMPKLEDKLSGGFEGTCTPRNIVLEDLEINFLKSQTSTVDPIISKALSLELFLTEIVEFAFHSIHKVDMCLPETLRIYTLLNENHKKQQPEEKAMN